MCPKIMIENGSFTPPWTNHWTVSNGQMDHQ